MIRKSLTLLFILFAFGLKQLYAQQQLTLSIEDALQYADRNNIEIKISNAELESAQADFQQTNALILPTIKLEYLASSTNNPLASFGYKLQQEIVQQSDFNPSLLNNPDNIQNYQASVILEQPIINVDGWHGRKAAALKIEAFEQKRERTKEHIELTVKRAYYGLQLANAQNHFLDKVVATTEQNYKLIENYYSQGLVKKDDLLEIEVRVLDANTKKQIAKTLRHKANNGLTYLLGIDKGIEIINSDTLSVEADKKIEDITLPSKRSDLKAYENGVAAHKHMLKSAKAGYLPRLNAFGAYNLNDSKVLGTNAKSWVVGAKLSMNLFDGYQTPAKVHKAKAELEKQELEMDRYLKQQQREIEQAQLQVEVARLNWESAKKAKDSAAESYRIKKNRFTEGLLKTTDLINAETAWATKNLEYLNAIYQYKMAAEYLDFLK